MLRDLLPGEDDQEGGDLFTGGFSAQKQHPFPGSIEESGEVDLNTFMGSTGDIVLFTFIETSGFGGIGVAARATVLAPSGDVVSSEPFVANAQQQHVLSEDGVYTIYFRANNLVAMGDYSMTLTCS